MIPTTDKYLVLDLAPCVSRAAKPRIGCVFLHKTRLERYTKPASWKPKTTNRVPPDQDAETEKKDHN
jgi:hypothetical protein